jgi:muramoyltetrapeptide carboxypeptidase
MTTLLKPAAVPTGAKLGLIAPASNPVPEKIDSGLARLRSLGYMPELAPHARSRGPLFFAGTPDQRLSDLYKVFLDPDVQAVMCLRGGYGSNYLLDKIDTNVLRAHPKVFVGYSDVTGMQLYLLDKIGLPAFHGPMAAIDFPGADSVHLPSFHAALAGETYSVGAAEGMHMLRRGTGNGTVRGTLYGGCLSIIVEMLGTPYAPQTEGKLLFIEDVDTRPYQIDRLLWQMRKAGKFAGVTGIVFGEMLGCAGPGEQELLVNAIMNALDGIDVPIAFGLRCGHTSHHCVTLTFGVQAEFNVDGEAQLSLLEPAVKR